MKNKKFLPEKTVDVIRRIRPRTLLICLLIVVLLVSASIGVGNAKFIFQSEPYSVDYQIKSYTLDSATHVLDTLTSAGNYRFDSPDGVVTLYYPQENADAAYPNTEKYVAYFQPGNTSVDYTSSDFQISIAYDICLTGIDHSSPLKQLAVTDDSYPLMVDFHLGSNADYTQIDYAADQLAYANTGLRVQKNSSLKIVRFNDIAQLFDPAFDPDGDASAETACSSFEVRYNNQAWSAYTDTSWYNDTDDEFFLSSAEDLAGLAELVNNGTDDFSGKTIYLEEDISLDDESGYLRRWIPIGTQASPFRGSFDGQNHEISGLNVANFGASGSSAATGLFGYVSGDPATASIKNLSIDTAYVSAELYVDPSAADRVPSGAMGALAGWTEGYTFSGISISSANICGIASCGGVMLGQCSAVTVIDASCTVGSGCSTDEGEFTYEGDLVGYQMTV